MSRIEDELAEQNAILQRGLERAAEDPEKLSWQDYVIGVSVGGVFLLLSSLFGCATTLYYAWAFHYLWAWFVSYPFGVAEVSTSQVFGVFFLLYYIKGFLMIGTRTVKEELLGDSSIQSLIGPAIGVLVSLGLGWTIFHFLIQR